MNDNNINNINAPLDNLPPAGYPNPYIRNNYTQVQDPSQMMPPVGTTRVPGPFPAMLDRPQYQSPDFGVLDYVMSYGAPTMEMLVQFGAAQDDLWLAKDAVNSHQGYKYANAQRMLTTIRTVLRKHGMVLIMADRLVYTPDGPAVYSTGIVYSRTIQSPPIIGVGPAVLQLDRKGTDKSQNTGSAISYARKYMLNGLFAIGDADSDPDGKDNSTLNNPEISTAALDDVTAGNPSYFDDTEWEARISYAMGHHTPKATDVCRVCGQPITSAVKDGKNLSAAYIAQSAHKVFGFSTCSVCMSRVRSYVTADKAKGKGMA